MDKKITKNQKLINSVGDIQYKNRDDWNSVKLSVSNFSTPFKNFSMEESFSKIIDSYTSVLVKEYLGKKLYDKIQNQIKKLEKEYNLPMKTVSETKLYNRLYRSLYWGYLKKQ